MADDDHIAYARYTTILLMNQQAELAKLNKAILRKNAKIARMKEALDNATKEKSDG